MNTLPTARLFLFHTSLGLSAFVSYCSKHFTAVEVHVMGNIVKVTGQLSIEDMSNMDELYNRLFRNLTRDKLASFVSYLETRFPDTYTHYIPLGDSNVEEGKVPVIYH